MHLFQEIAAPNILCETSEHHFSDFSFDVYLFKGIAASKTLVDFVNPVGIILDF